MSTSSCPDPSRAPRRALRRRRLAVGISAAALLGTTAWAPTAFATHYEASLEGTQDNAPSQFEIDFDADLTRETLLYDWGNVTQDVQNDLLQGRLDDSYAGGVKEDTVCPAQTTGSIPPNKSDLLQFGIWEEPGSPGYLHMYWARITDPTGTTLMDFEFNQSDEDCSTGPNKLRTDGDLLIEYSIDQGGARADMTLRRWDGTAGAWGLPDDIDADAMAAGTINSTTITQTDTLTQNQSPRTFGEASIDLNLIFDDTKCESFGSATLKSRSSDSFTSQLKDFIAPLDIDLTNCAKVIIHKETVPDGATDSFGYTKDFDTDPATVDTFSLTDGGTETFDNVLLGTGLTVDETTLPSGWEFDSVDCADSVQVTPSFAGSKVTFTLDSTSDVLECTYTNRAFADLTIVKQVSDAPGGQAFGFTTSANLDSDGFSLTPSGTGAAGQATTGSDYHDIAPGSYTVAETVPAGWNLVSQTCTGGTDTNPADGITLAAGESLTCTFVNARERGAIDITKTRKHQAAGGNDVHAGVTFTVSGNGITPVQVQTDANGKACVPNLLYGSYTVTETVPTGYAGQAPKSASVTAEANCGANLTPAADVSFVNTPLTNITVSVDSQVNGGTASTIVCVDKDGAPVTHDQTSGSNGDLSKTYLDKLPTDPAATLVCTITVDP